MTNTSYWVQSVCLDPVVGLQMGAVSLQWTVQWCLPGNTPVRFNPQDSGVFSVVKLDFRVSEFSTVNVHQD